MLIYAGIAAFGFLFLTIMLFAGDLFGGDHEVSAHGGIDHAGEFGGPSVFSARIMASFLTAFGVGGVVARYYDLSHPAASGVGIVAGIVMSSIVFQFAKVLYSQQASSELKMATLIGRSAEVSVAIPASGVGKVAFSTDRVSLTPGTRTLFDADGSSLVIHANADDQMTNPSGNSGARIACGVVKALP